jgi:hypothetical protein
MATEYTTELIDKAWRGEHVPPPQRIERHYFSHVVKTAVADGDILYLVTIPKGKRLVGGLFKNTAGGQTVTGSIGDYTYEKVMEGEPAVWTGEYAWTVGTADTFGSLTTLAGATSQTFGDTGAKGAGTEGVLTNFKETRIGVLFADDGGGETVQVGAVISGHVDFI